MAGADANVTLAALLEQCLFSVHKEIQDHLLKLIWIGHRMRKVGIKLGFHVNIFDPQLVAAQGYGAFDDLVQIHTSALRLIFAREIQEIFHDAASALRLLVNFLGFGELRLAEAKKVNQRSE